MGVKVKEKKPGEWWIFVHHKKKRKSKKAGSEKAAREAAAKIEALLTLGDTGFFQEEKEVKTFGEYAAIWLKSAEIEFKEGTISIYKTALNKHILPKFKNTPIDSITRGMVKGFLQEKIAEGIKASTANTYKTVFSCVLGKALDDEVIARNPAQRLDRWHKKEGKIKHSPLNKKETALLLETFKKHYPKDYAMAFTLARTGMRIGEVCGLQWGDIDFNSRFIEVKRNVSHRGTVGTTKTDKVRKVDLSAQLAEVLLEHKKQMRIEAVKRGWGELPEWVFVSSTKNPILRDYWRERVFNKALEKAGLRKIGIHDLRHGYSHQLLKEGASLLYVSHQLGHSSIKVTADEYGEVEREHDAESKRLVVDCLDDDASTRTPGASNKIMNV